MEFIVWKKGYYNVDYNLFTSTSIFTSAQRELLFSFSTFDYESVRITSTIVKSPTWR